MADVDWTRQVGDTVWVYPESHPLPEHPAGFGFFISIVHGPVEPRNPYSDKIWTSGYVFDQVTGAWRDEPIPLVIARDQPLAGWEDPAEPARSVVRGGRRYRRVA